MGSLDAAEVVELVRLPEADVAARARRALQDRDGRAPDRVVDGRAPVGERGSDLGDVIDARARAEYEQRIRDLTADIEEAEQNNDEGRAAMLEAERDVLLSQLAGALGLTGRARRQGGDAERARKAVGMRVRDAIGRIEEGLPPLGRHLRLSVHTGMFCTYVPERPMNWHCQP